MMHLCREMKEDELYEQEYEQKDELCEQAPRNEALRQENEGR